MTFSLRVAAIVLMITCNLNLNTEAKMRLNETVDKQDGEDKKHINPKKSSVDNIKIADYDECFPVCTQTCFPGDSEVMVDGGETKSMEELRIGDIILTIENGNIVPTKVLGFLDKKINITGAYLNLILENGRSLFISARHTMFVKGDGNRIESILAKDVSIGDMVIVADDKEIVYTGVLDMSQVPKMGAYVPLTEAGTLLVDGVLVSSYSNMDHSLAHIISAPLRWWPTWLLDSHQSQDVEGIRTVPWLGRELLNILGLVTLAEQENNTVDHPLMAMENMDKTEF